MPLIAYTARVPIRQTYNPAEAYNAKSVAEDYARDYDKYIVSFLDVELDDERVADVTNDVHDILSSYASRTGYDSKADKAFSDDLWDAISSLAYARGGNFDDRSVQEFYYKLSYISSQAEAVAADIVKSLIEVCVSRAGLSVTTTTHDVVLSGELDAAELKDALKSLDNTCPGMLDALKVDYRIVDGDIRFDDPAWIRSNVSL